MNGRILIVDDLASNRIVYRARLAAAFYDPILACDGAGCLAMAQAGPDLRPDIILLDLCLPDMSGHEVLRRLRSDPRSRDIPVIVLTAAQDPDERLAAFAAGADEVIAKPAPDQLLLARLRNLLRARVGVEFVADGALPIAGLSEAPATFEPAGTVAVVASGPDRAARLQLELAPHLRDRLVVLSRSQALAEVAALGGPDVFVVLEDESGVAGALRLVSELKSHQATHQAAVCVQGLGGHADAAAIAFDLGADDVVGPGVTSRELALRLQSLLRRKRAADRQRARMQDNLRLAMVDPLTGLYNRRYAVPHLRDIAARAGENGNSFAVMVIDLDRFKLVNDRYGHAAGDEVLVEIARRLTANLREGDLLARIGGEEFLVVLPASDRPDARAVAERLCHAVEERPITLPSGQVLRVTVSIGVAVSNGGGSIEAIVEQADQAMLQSKGAGRNRVRFPRSAA